MKEQFFPFLHRILYQFVNFEYHPGIMNRIITPFLLLIVCATAHAQKVSSKPRLEQGQVLQITLQLKTTIAQQAMGQAIDFTVDATGDHSYRVTNSTDENSTLNHEINRVRFIFDGMGQKRNFDSNEEKDMNGPFGKPVKELLEKKYDMVIDTSGKTLMCLPEKITLSGDDNRMAILRNMMKDIFGLVQPPAKGSASFFKILPEAETGVGESWIESWAGESGKYEAAYKIREISDTVIVVDFATQSVTISKAEMMGNETTTTMNNKSTGTILIDRASGIMREKTENTESNGNTETSFGTLPVTSRTTTTITVKKRD